MNRYLVIGILVFTISGMTIAQNTDSITTGKNEFSIMVSGYLSLPTGDFGEKIGDGARVTRRQGLDIGQNVGLATTGFGAGLEIQKEVITSGLHWIVSLRMLYNNTDPATAESIFKQEFGDTAAFEYETGSWLNLPILTGFRYNYPVTGDLTLSAFVQGGINFVQAPSRKATLGGIQIEETTFDFTQDYGYELGLGAELFRNYFIALSYLDLGTPLLRGKRLLSREGFPEIIYPETQIIGEERSISMFLVTFGYYIY